MFFFDILVLPKTNIPSFGGNRAVILNSVAYLRAKSTNHPSVRPLCMVNLKAHTLLEITVPRQTAQYTRCTHSIQAYC